MSRFKRGDKVIFSVDGCEYTIAAVLESKQDGESLYNIIDGDDQWKGGIAERYLSSPENAIATDVSTKDLYNELLRREKDIDFIIGVMKDISSVTEDDPLSEKIVSVKVLVDAVKTINFNI